ncbi:MULTISPECIES: carboxypeptidase-like regulatory domain-containing protein [unclassified Flavobacterium]|uniref:carboxypeptidase-like regulatory domain-containing protein n=1 Tax=unclassified Flavobacterium TaxID=196869 RepID=UPI001F12DE28|nr:MULTISPECIES: carboxypeptidase-like regulatory domain-containing protein [unclassified Flavobacterium]UMY64420.1 carboxypeptidase-like regulatory domain-containing protein [Flavobacterium sp. HJ-32-4]
MKLLTLACLGIFLTTCDPNIELDGSSRLVSEGIVTNAAGTPLAHTKIVVTASIPGVTDTLQSVKTDGNGHFKIAFLSPSSATTPLSIRAEAADEQYLPTSVNGLNKSTFTGYYRDMGTIRLFRQTELVTLQIDYPEEAYYGRLDNIYLVAEGAIAPLEDYPTLPTTFKVAPNQQAVLHYTRLASVPGERDQEEEVVITIGLTDTVFTFTL